MTEIRAVHVDNLYRSIITSGYAMTTEPYNYEKEMENIDKHIARCKRLVKLSKETDVHCHDNFLTGIHVTFDIKYPQYLSPELQRYHFLDIITSQSKMHKLTKMKIHKMVNEYTDPDCVRACERWVYVYNAILKDDELIHYNFPRTIREDDGSVRTEYVTFETREEALYQAYMRAVSSCPLGLELWMGVTTNYKQLQTIYHQRRKHQLKEDWGAVIKMIEGLPFFQEFILGE